MDNNNVMAFVNEEFGYIRTVRIDGEPWFVAKDVASALGYANPQKAIRDHVDEEDKGVNDSFTPGGMQKMPIINESGLYSLMLSSKLETAKIFKRWVTSEVLPALRKDGGYVMPGGEEEYYTKHLDEILEAATTTMVGLKTLQVKVADIQRQLAFAPDDYAHNVWKKNNAAPLARELASKLGISDAKKVYDMIYNRMKERCGFNSLVAVCDYRSKYGLDKYVEITPITAVSDSEFLRSEFVRAVSDLMPLGTVPTDGDYLGDMPDEENDLEEKGDVIGGLLGILDAYDREKESEKVKKTSAPKFFGKNDRIEDMTRAVAERMGDTSAHNNRTYRMLYSEIATDKSWKTMMTRTGCRSKKQIVDKCPSYKSAIRKSVTNFSQIKI